jgi:hypothetical protein
MTKCHSASGLPHPASTNRTVIGLCRPPNSGMASTSFFNFSGFSARRLTPIFFMSAILISCTLYEGRCVTGDFSTVFLALGFLFGPQFAVMVVTFFFRCLSRFRPPSVLPLRPKPLVFLAIWSLLVLALIQATAAPASSAAARALPSAARCAKAVKRVEFTVSSGCCAGPGPGPARANESSASREGLQILTEKFGAKLLPLRNPTTGSLV